MSEWLVRSITPMMTFRPAKMELERQRSRLTGSTGSSGYVCLTLDVVSHHRQILQHPYIAKA